MVVRRYMTSDCEQLAELFYQTVHTVNSKDYTNEQLDVWANGNVNTKERDISIDYSSIRIIKDKGLLLFSVINWSRQSL